MKPSPPAPAAPRQGRDLRLDFFRGLSLFFIFIDHIPGNVLSHFTVQSIAFSDAAEVFIFISGYTAALVYGRILRQSGALFATAQIYRRVWQLYVAHIFLFVIFTAEVSYTLVAFENSMYTEELGIANFLDTPHLAILRALVLMFQPNFLDILPLYIVLLALFPLVLIGLERQPLLPLAASTVLYVLTLIFGWSLHTYPGDEPWFFNPLAWQLLFVFGATSAHVTQSGGMSPLRRRWVRQLAVGAAACFTVINFTWMVHWLYDPFPGLFLKQLWNFTVDKTNLAPLRLANFLALAAATVQFVKPDARFLHHRAAWPIVLCGRHSLYIFCLGILLSVLGHFVLSEYANGLLLQLAVNLGGFAIMIGTAAMLEWYKNAGRAPQRTPAPTLATTPSE